MALLKSIFCILIGIVLGMFITIIAIGIAMDEEERSHNNGDQENTDSR